MTTESRPGTPKSPEAQEPNVSEDLDQDTMTHQGDYRKAPTGPLTPEMRRRGYLGATEDENVPVLPPMSGSGDEEEEDTGVQDAGRGKTRKREDMIEPRDELTPG